MNEEFIEYIENYLLLHNWDANDVNKALRECYHWSCKLHSADQHLYNSIYSAVEDFCTDNDYDFDELFDMDGYSTDPDMIVEELFQD